MSAAALDAPAPSSAKVEDVVAVYQRERGKPMPGFQHARTQSRLVRQFAKDTGYEALSELNLDLNGWRCVPDICLYPVNSTTAMQHEVWVTMPPKLAVEIISPSQTLDEMTAKIGQLLAAGVPSVWLVIPFARVISICQKGLPPLSATTGILTDPATGIAVNVDEIFA